MGKERRRMLSSAPVCLGVKLPNRELLQTFDTNQSAKLTPGGDMERKKKVIGN